MPLRLSKTLDLLSFWRGLVVRPATVLTKCLSSQKKILDMWQGPFGIIATLLLSDPVQWLQPFSHGTSVCTAASARWLRSLFTWFRSTFGLSFWLEPIARNHLGESFTAFAAPLQSCGRSNFFLPITIH